MVESYHWHLDVMFQDDANGMVNKATAYNLNIVKKMAMNMLRLVDVSIVKISLKNKRLILCMNFIVRLSWSMIVLPSLNIESSRIAVQ